MAMFLLQRLFCISLTGFIADIMKWVPSASRDASKSDKYILWLKNPAVNTNGIIDEKITYELNLSMVFSPTLPLVNRFFLTKGYVLLVKHSTLGHSWTL